MGQLPLHCAAKSGSGATALAKAALLSASCPAALHWADGKGKTPAAAAKAGGRRCAKMAATLAEAA
eukprot:SAG11_NODE_4675_length_1811_cov_2.134930_3_plen_65_part_01